MTVCRGVASHFWFVSQKVFRNPTWLWKQGTIFVMSIYNYIHICNISDPIFNINTISITLTYVFREFIATLDFCISLRKPLVCFDTIEANKYIMKMSAYLDNISSTKT